MPGPFWPAPSRQCLGRRLGAQLGIALGITLGSVAACSGHSTTGEAGSSRSPRSTPSNSGPTFPTAIPNPGQVPASDLTEESFIACLKTHGVEFPRDDRLSAATRIRIGVQACAKHIPVGRVVQVPVSKGDPYQACLASHGTKLPPPGKWLKLDRRDRVTDTAIKSC